MPDNRSLQEAPLFVEYLALKLTNIPGIENAKARDDADCLIIDTALSAAAEYL